MESPFRQFTFVFTGEMDISRDKASEFVRLLGGRVTTALSGKTTYLVAGNEPGESKISKANILKIKIINEDEFMKMVNKNELNDIINTRIGTASEEINSIDYEKETEISYRKDKKLVEKYRPSKKEELVGNKVAINQLEDFLQKKTKYMAALVSGSPGVGKTTTAHLLSKSCGYDIIEFNASCVRNKNSLQEQIGKYIEAKSILENKKVIIMDEVDGMFSDHGGIAELINIIKKTKVPIICICNDQSHIKMKSLINNCMDIRFRRLDSLRVLTRVKEILKNEKMRIPENNLKEIINRCGNDMRYILNTITTWKLKIKDIYSKNTDLGVFEITREMFQRKNVNEKINLYFEDYRLIPLFVHENYIKANVKSESDGIKKLYESADSISYSDIIDGLIHGTRQEWSLMPSHALFSCIIPTNGLTLHKRIEFPTYLANISISNKNMQILTSIALKCGIEKNEFIFYYGRLLDRFFYSELENENINGALDILKHFNLTRDDMIELNKIFFNDFKTISTKIKTQLTKKAKTNAKINKTIADINEIEEE